MDKSTQIYAATAATLGAFGLGTVLAWTSPGLPSMRKDSDDFRDISTGTESWIGAILCAGAFFSAPVVGVLMDTIGRKPTMMILSLPFLLGWLLMGFATNLAMMLVGRVAAGSENATRYPTRNPLPNYPYPHGYPLLATRYEN
ncbi:Facilitated trehalose transporter Tret1 [Folsomia candida]|uniref:Facilitated trehalose transporter Tret1 n=1 Tax=Folsomia candida TaxID=158441 RepID=A0A226DWU7_FOLCA|nr:Facilitated trehalose transporter Tret1 [Folsomia candida]